MRERADDKGGNRTPPGQSLEWGAATTRHAPGLQFESSQAAMCKEPTKDAS